MTTYRVVGPHAALGAEPGATFEASLSPEIEDYYVTAGHIERVETYRFKAGEFTEEAIPETKED